jgi:hypothetical protein
MPAGLLECPRMDMEDADPPRKWQDEKKPRFPSQQEKGAPPKEHKGSHKPFGKPEGFFLSLTEKNNKKQ